MSGTEKRPVVKMYFPDNAAGGYGSPPYFKEGPGVVLPIQVRTIKNEYI